MSPINFSNPRRKILVAVAVLLLAVGGYAAITPQAHNDTQQAIASVLTQRLNLRKTEVRRLPNGNRVLNQQGYLAAIEKIDTSACPTEFRVAWLSYVQSWERHIDGNPLTGTMDLVTGLTTGNFSHATREADLANTTEHFRTVERVAMKFDVSMPKDAK